MILTGAVRKFGDDLGATDLVPARYDKLGMSHQWAECAKHVLEDVAPGMAETIRPGDILVGGQGFGAGHAHYYSAAVMGCRTAGFGALLAEGIGGLFQRAAIDFGMPAWSFPGIAALVSDGDQLEIDLATGVARNLTTGAQAQFKPVSPIILDILAAGGSEGWALTRVQYRAPDEVMAAA